ncbi:bys1 domain [Diplodia corticola]|uniref:Bys1 domain n=1 Tax=Diplodia corticola TaxID=236234 RepID=A0A1J9SHP9_9PEZI|nr:bys1 domain [Diplodia corticola]OJD39903.1 bys1 domain [Diplodia corticola]
MKNCSELVALALFGLASFARADRDVKGATGSVDVFNYCKGPVYLRSVGDHDPPETTLDQGGRWSEPYKEKDIGGGPSIKIRTEDTEILQLEYTAQPTRVWYDLSYIDCWNQTTQSGQNCPFWNQSFVVEAPNVPPISCATGESCPYPYRCPLDDRPAISTIPNSPIFLMMDPTQNLTLHLCPCENQPDSRECEMARDSAPQAYNFNFETMKTHDACPDGSGKSMGSQRLHRLGRPQRHQRPQRPQPPCSHQSHNSGEFYHHWEESECDDLSKTSSSTGEILRGSPQPGDNSVDPLDDDR